MEKTLYNNTLTLEERRTVKWFLIFFYFILIGYDSFYYYFLPAFIEHRKIGFPNMISYFTYVVVLCLVPVAIFLIKHNKHYYVKYLYSISYILTTLFVDIFTYYETKAHFASGNVVEIFLILTTPLFINTRYFWVTSAVIIGRYILMGLIVHSSVVVVPILLLVILAIVAYIFLKRIIGFVQSIKLAYDKQLGEIVKGVIAVLELKDPYTRGHSERVARYALELAKAVHSFTDDELKSFYNACLLHDIGKVHVPDRILLKPARLSNEEFEIIKTHPAVGADAVQDVIGLENDICVIRSHHERWDGTGYPDQLKGEEIPLRARITALADAFDAMTSSRSYRAALSVQEAFNRINDARGTQFDPKLVEEFNKIFPIWVNIHKSYPLDIKAEQLGGEQI